MSGLRDDALATLRSWQPPDPHQARLRDAYVGHLDAHPDGTGRDAHPAHLTAGALVVSADHRTVLLTLHAKAHRWFHLGGHCEPDDATLLAAARREAIEESGIEELLLDPDPLHLDSHEVAFCGRHVRVSHLDVRFLAVAPAGAEPVVSDESLDVRWWPVDDLPADDADVAVMVTLALRRLDRTQTSSAAI